MNFHLMLVSLLSAFGDCTSQLRGDGPPNAHTKMDKEKYVEEAMFICSSDTKCPVLSTSWGVVIARDPSTGKEQTFRDVMAGPGWVKEWNWGHHSEHVHHKTGIPPAEIDEVYDEMKKHDPTNMNLDAFFISRGVKGVLKENPDGVARVKELWKVDPDVATTTELVNNYDSTIEAVSKKKLAAVEKKLNHHHHHDHVREQSLAQQEYSQAKQKMVEAYNSLLANGKRAAIILHSTC